MPQRSLTRTRIKFCGFTREQDIEGAARLGVDAIGLVCVPASKRALTPQRAAELRATIPPLVSCVLLLSNADEALAREAIARVRPDFIQFHGQETADECGRHGLPYFKAVAVNTPGDVADAVADFPGARALLLDSHGADGMGGTGSTFDWSLIPRDLEMPLILAGGLNPENVGRAVRMSPLYAVDVSSGIESSPGIKDPRRMQAFVQAVRMADDKRAR